MTNTVKEQLSELAQQAYLECDTEVSPLYPNVLVKLLPRAQVSAGGIYLPDKQNKPMLEAVVIEVFKPFYRHFQTTAAAEKIEELVKATVAEGDHVIFQHFLGAPVPRLDGGIGEFRLVKDEDLVGVIEYSPKDDMRDWLAKKLVEAGVSDDLTVKAAIHRILAEAHIVRKDLHSVTTSGA